MFMVRPAVGAHSPAGRGCWLPFNPPRVLIMRKSYPVEFTAELRGVTPASEFTNRETGELVKLAPTLQLEASNDDGSVELHQVRLSDRLDSALNVKELVRGLVVKVRGDAIISDNGASYFKYLAVGPAAA